METTHRKIELQSPLDLLYLSKNTTRTASEILDLHFPPSAAPASASDDPLRTRVQELVDAYIATVFENARPNLSINGLEGKEMEEARVMAEGEGQELEPYDTKLATKLHKLSAQVENLTLQLANLRRTAPAQAAAAYASTLDDDEKRFEDARTRAEDDAKRRLQEHGVSLGMENVRDWDECERNWDMATKSLLHVKESIGATSARLVQARDAAAYLDQVGK
ncbi:hypothetical protein E4T39_00518 [Aureobasidium subglaciale]|nr:hypothetical protein E4T39_00518 [Aureobasidium subglaciale]